MTEADITLWLENYVPHVAITSGSRREYYVRAWRVVEKIRAAIAAGTWPPMML